MRQFSAERLTNYAGCAGFIFLAMWTVFNVREASLLLLPTLAHESFVALAFLVREPARIGAPGLVSRVCAYGGTFLLVLFFNVAQMWYPSWLVVNPMTTMTATGVLLWLAGAGFVLVALWSLRHSFSIEPQARRLVTTGAYRYARHPIYTCYFLQYAGLLMIFPTAPFASVLIVWTGLMVMRMHFEERVLEQAFPEYAAYKAEVGPFAPKRRPVAREVHRQAATEHA